MADAIDSLFLARARAQHLVPVLTLGDADIVVPLLDALVAAGVACVEVTLRDAEDALHLRLIAEHFPTLLVAAGGVTNETQWEAAQAAQVSCITSPGATPLLYELSASTTTPWLPGVQTPTEIATALAAGYRVQRLFPAPLGGARAIRILTSAFPEARFLPMGVIDAEQWPDYLALPAVTALAVTALTPPALVVSGQWMEITRRARSMLENVQREAVVPVSL
jgi:2-dehydro-3-deoxyphosphogluconate aldolase/(4S)-4-hydroxy-2-oxoglutarate aldolase